VSGDDKSSRDLAEMLVEEGFARIFTKGTQLPGGKSEADIKQGLHALESASRANRRGAWNH
jgi:endonuclease YncB( thermonuclease family)